MGSTNPTFEAYPEKDSSGFPVNEYVTTKQDIGETAQRRRKRKWMAVCIVLSVILILAITAILILIFVKRQQIIINKTTSIYIGDKEVKEVVYQDTKESLIQYHFVDGDQETSVILDLNRDLEIIKIQGFPGSAICYLSPIAALDPQFSAPGNGSQKNGTTTDNNQYSWSNKTSVVNFKRSPFALKETSILGPKGEALCKDTEVFWSLPQCPSDSAETSRNTGEPPSGLHRRRKRNSWVLRWAWNWSSCYYFSFPEQNWRSYFHCDIIYFWVWE